GPGVAADVVVADDVDVVGAGLPFRLGALVEHPVADGVVGDVVAERLRHATEALAANGNDGLADLLALAAGYGLDVVADQADRAFRLHGDAAVERKHLLDLVDHLVELLVTTEDDVLLLEIGGDLHGAEGID